MDRRTLRLLAGWARAAEPAARGKGFPTCRLWLALGLGLAGAYGPAFAGNDPDLVLRIDYALPSLPSPAAALPEGMPDDAGLLRDIGCPGAGCERLALAVDHQLHLLPEQASVFPGAMSAALLQAQHGGQASAGTKMPPETGVQLVAGKWNAGPGKAPDNVRRPSLGEHSERALGQFAFPYEAGCTNCQIKDTTSFTRQIR